MPSDDVAIETEIQSPTVKGCMVDKAGAWGERIRTYPRRSQQQGLKPAVTTNGEKSAEGIVGGEVYTEGPHQQPLNVTDKPEL